MDVIFLSKELVMFAKTKIMPLDASLEEIQ